MIRRAARVAGAATAVLAAVALSGAPAGAINEPVVDAAAPTPSGNTGPSVPMAQRGECVVTALRTGTDIAATTAAARQLNLPGAWAYSRGEGQKVAVIDTGVNAGPQLPNLIGGGDFLGTGNGLTDCDGHGTLVAGLIAGQPGVGAFSGVAPGAEIIALRQTSPRFSPNANGQDPAATRAAADIDSLARSVVHAADLGARVIVISMTTCLPADSTLNQSALGAALRYAARDKDAVIIAAAGDIGGANTNCQANPLGGIAGGADPRSWGGVGSLSVPAWWSQYVLSVGSVDDGGQPSGFSMSGPWLGIAAPGENILSLSNAAGGGLANATPDGRGKYNNLSGTGYASAYVAGVAALVRSRFPDLPANQVVDRLTRTAHNGARSPSNLVGAGVVDPVAALTWELPARNTGPAQTPIDAPVPVPEADHTGRIVSFTGAGLLALIVAGAALTMRRRTDQPWPENPSPEHPREEAVS